MLSARRVETIIKAGKYGDSNGLFLHVRASGSKSWVQRLTIGGKRRDLGLGGYPAVSLRDAREIALANKKIARTGGNPFASRVTPTFEESARTVHKLNLPTWSNKKHAAQFISTLETYAFPFTDHRPIDTLTVGDVLNILTPIWTSKPETARRVKQRLSVVFKWAMVKGYRADNPVEAVSAGLPTVPKSQRHHASLPYTDVAGCIAAVRASGAWVSTKLALEFLILTAARSGEVRGATWGEIDGATWTIPAQRMKAHRDHRVPLSTRALEILEQSKGHDLIFPSLHDKALSDATLSKLVKSLGFSVTIHGFRTSFRTWVQDQTDTPREVAEAALAHSTGNAVERAYARSDLFEKRRALMTAWSDYLDRQP